MQNMGKTNLKSISQKNGQNGKISAQTRPGCHFALNLNGYNSVILTFSHIKLNVDKSEALSF